MGRKLGLGHLLPLLVVVVYTVIGGGIFLAFEHAHDSGVRGDAFRDYKARWAQSPKSIETWRTGVVRPKQLLVDGSSLFFSQAH